MQKKVHLETIPFPGCPIYHVGPALSDGPLPALFYFALSGEESLILDPYNQPIAHLIDAPIRKISFTLPFHGEGYVNSQTMHLWAEELNNNPSFLSVFYHKVLGAIEYLVEREIIDPNKMAVAGLSRGGFIATHIAALEPRIHTILGFAPLTSFDRMSEFKDIEMPEHIKKLALINLVDQLVCKEVRFYVGNRDLRVGTGACFSFIEALTEASAQKGVRSAPVSLFIYPSIGHKGHGTPPHIFADGAEWAKSRLL